MNSFDGVIIIDTNLGLDINSDYWKNFFSQHSCSALCLTDLEVIFSQLKEVKPIAAYVPAPIYYYIKSDGKYDCLASAIHPSNKSVTSTLQINL